MYRSILVPLDGSPLSEQALPLAREIGEAAEGPTAVWRKGGDGT